MSNEPSDLNNAFRRPTEPAAVAESKIRGLPLWEDLRGLGRTYLHHQHQEWPELICTSVLPDITEASIRALAEAYESAYRSKQYQAFDPRGVRAKWATLGAAYMRYSDSSSNARSLDQQLMNILRTAGRERSFIPFCHVFGDAAIPGTTTVRTGNQMLGQLVQSLNRSFDRLFVDDLDRLNRDELASLQFMRLLETHGKRLNDTKGFDSIEPMAKMVSSFNGIQNEQFSYLLRGKVNRGMTDAFNQGKNVGSFPLGYKRMPRSGADGQTIIGRKGTIETDVVIDDVAAEVVQRIFRLYSGSKMSPAKIARLLDQEQALDKHNWCSSTVSTLLKNERYIGRVYWKRTRTVTNPRTGKKAATPRPESEHLFRVIPAMQIVSDELWDAVRRREREVSRDTRSKNGSARSRQSLYPTRLFDMHCQYCGTPLRLAKAGKYAQLFCPWGKEGLRGCTLQSSKGLRITDECLLANLKLLLLKPGALEQLLRQANAFLAEEAAKPPVDTASTDEAIAAATVKLKRLATQWAEFSDGPAADTVLEFIGETESQLDDLKLQRELAAKSNFRPAPIDDAAMDRLLTDLRNLVQEDAKAADAILAKSLGQVHVALGEKRGRTHAWVADLSIDPVPVLLAMALRKDCPSTHSLEYLLVRGWTIPISAQIEINRVTNYQRIAATASEMRGNGASFNAIAVALMSDAATVKQALAWAEENDGSFLTTADLSCRRRHDNCKTDRIGPVVARLCDEEGKSFAAIARELGTTQGTASRAYKQYHAEQNLAAVRRGEILDSGPRRRIPQEKIDEIRRLLIEGKLSGRKIAEQVGCAPVTARLEKKRMEAEQAGEADGPE